MQLPKRHPNFEQYDRERKATIAGARQFALACRLGDAEKFFEALEILEHVTVDGWPIALRAVARLDRVHPKAQHAFLTFWIEHKSFALHVGDRAALCRALPLLFPKQRKPRKPLVIYRGCSARERRHHSYNFSWTTDLKVAKLFAEDRRVGGDCVVLEAVAPPAAVIFTRKYFEDYYPESEIVVQPWKLGAVKVVEKFPGLPRSW